MLSIRLAAILLFATASFIAAAIAGVSGVDDYKLAYGVVALVCLPVSLGLILDLERKGSTALQRVPARSSSVRIGRPH